MRKLGKADFTAFTFVEPGTSNQIAGTLAWQHPDKLLEAGTHEEGWVFTPADDAKYADVTGTVEVTVVPAKVTGAPKYTAITQSGEIVLWAAASTGGGSSSGGGSYAPAEGGEVVTVENKAGASTQIITKVTVKDAKTETTRNAQGQDVSKTTAAVSEKLAEQLVSQAVSNKSDVVEITVSSEGKNSDAATADCLIWRLRSVTVSCTTSRAARHISPCPYRKR